MSLFDDDNDPLVWFTDGGSSVGNEGVANGRHATATGDGFGVGPDPYLAGAAITDLDNLWENNLDFSSPSTSANNNDGTKRNLGGTAKGDDAEASSPVQLVPPPTMIQSFENDDDYENTDKGDDDDGNKDEGDEEVVETLSESERKDGASLKLPREESRLEVIIDPLPKERHDEYEIVPLNDCVSKVFARARGRNRYKIQYDDGRLSEISEIDLHYLPNGSKALHKFKRSKLEDEDELSYSTGEPFRNKKICYGSDYSTAVDTGDISRSLSLGSVVQDDPMDLDSHDDASLVWHHAKRRRSGLRHSFCRASGASEDDTDEPTDGRRLRTKPSRSSLANHRQRSAPHKSPQVDDMDELAGNDDVDFIPTMPSKLRNAREPRRHRKKNRLLVKRSMRDESVDFDYRRSSRSNKNTRSMAVNIDYDDDDAFFIDDDQAAVQSRTPNVKEIFQPLDEPSLFKDMHSPLCDTCSGPEQRSNKGILIYCQGCSLSFHRLCIGIRSARNHISTKIAEDSFVLQCRYCVNQPKTKEPTCPDLDTCQVCSKSGPSCAPFSQKKTTRQEEKLRQENDGVDPITPVDSKLINNADNVLFRCKVCRRGYHFEHLPSSTNQWEDSDNANIRQDRLAEYSFDWTCLDCSETDDKVESLVAWRPLSKESYQPGQTCMDFKEDAKEYLVKWAEKSYAHCQWRPGPWVWGVCHSRILQKFVKKNGDMGVLPIFETKDAIPEEYLLADVIFMVRYKHKNLAKSKKEDLECIDSIDQIMVKFQGLGYDATVWDEPPPRDSGNRWTSFYMAYDEYLNGKHFKSDSQHRMLQRVEEFQSREKFELATKQPSVLRRGKLMPYQLEGLNWLLLNFYKGTNVVLADEMGLGKTVQVVALLASLVLESPRCWPFLVVVPNSTCSNWRREIKTWAPDLRVVSYHGGRESQSLAYNYELFPDGSHKMQAHVVVMSYDSAQDSNNRRLFRSVHWAGLVVDEGQRLKNDQSLLYSALRAMHINFRLLLTGTPLQNNKRELFNILQFIDSSNKAEELDQKYDQITSENLPELHKLIRPYFLRRTKAEVLKFLPPMAQIIVPVSMTVVQEKLCKSIIAKNPNLIQSIFSQAQVKWSERGSLNNILMQLRKCLCHPFVYSAAIEDKTVDVETMHRNLIEASSKLLLLKVMLPKLKERGHRVLLFSQFLNQLDIIEDFLQIIGLPYNRLDGSLSSLEKQKRIDEFNAPDSEIFAFLLSTRAGGVGINLATADTVIIMDPDFNPHQDVQAFSRAHRIGQKKKVLCFQFMTKDSVEEKIMQIGRSKMALDHALIEKMDAEDDAGHDLESILKHGAEALFSSDDKKTRIDYDSASVDKLLDRSQMENTKTDEGRTADSQFSFARVWANETGTLTDDIQVTTAPDGVDNTAALGVWENIIKEREEEAARLAEAKKEVLGRGNRRRNKVLYTAQKYADVFGEGNDEVVIMNNNNEDDHDGEFSANDDSSSSDGERDGGSRSRAQLTAAFDATAAHGPADRVGSHAHNQGNTTPKEAPVEMLLEKKQSPTKTKLSAKGTPITRSNSQTAPSIEEPTVKMGTKLNRNMLQKQLAMSASPSQLASIARRTRTATLLLGEPNANMSAGMDIENASQAPPETINRGQAFMQHPNQYPAGAYPTTTTYQQFFDRQYLQQPGGPNFQHVPAFYAGTPYPGLQPMPHPGMLVYGQPGIGATQIPMHLTANSFPQQIYRPLPESNRQQGQQMNLPNAMGVATWPADERFYRHMPTAHPPGPVASPHFSRPDGPPAHQPEGRLTRQSSTSLAGRNSTPKLPIEERAIEGPDSVARREALLAQGRYKLQSLQERRDEQVQRINYFANVVELQKQISKGRQEFLAKQHQQKACDNAEKTSIDGTGGDEFGDFNDVDFARERANARRSLCRARQKIKWLDLEIQAELDAQRVNHSLPAAVPQEMISPTSRGRLGKIESNTTVTASSTAAIPNVPPPLPEQPQRPVKGPKPQKTSRSPKTTSLPEPSRQPTSSPLSSPASSPLSPPTSTPANSAKAHPRMVVEVLIKPPPRCRRCNVPYPTGSGCLNLECDMGMRLAFDSLRSSPLKDVTARRKTLDSA